MLPDAPDSSGRVSRDIEIRPYENLLKAGERIGIKISGKCLLVQTSVFEGKNQFGDNDEALQRRAMLRKNERGSKPSPFQQYPISPCPG
jgi:hypothetical protein